MRSVSVNTFPAILLQVATTDGFVPSGKRKGGKQHSLRLNPRQQQLSHRISRHQQLFYDAANVPFFISQKSCPLGSGTATRFWVYLRRKKPISALDQRCPMQQPGFLRNLQSQAFNYVWEFLLLCTSGCTSCALAHRLPSSHHFDDDTPLEWLNAQSVSGSHEPHLNRQSIGHPSCSSRLQHFPDEALFMLNPKESHRPILPWSISSNMGSWVPSFISTPHDKFDSACCMSRSCTTVQHRRQQVQDKISTTVSIQEDEFKNSIFRGKREKHLRNHYQHRPQIA